MKAAPLLITWHNEKAPIYSVQFEPLNGKGRLATAGGDNNVRIWRVESNGIDRQVTYLATLSKHTQAVNVVRWRPQGELLASAGDDGNIIIWTPTDKKPTSRGFGEDDLEDKEYWNHTRIFRSSTSSASNHEIYDLAWSPDGTYLVTGSMDNVARIYDAQTGTCVRQIAEHNNYVQGVAWDPLNEYLATQSSDRSIHIYKLRSNDGQFTLSQHNKVSRMDLPLRRPSSNSPAPPDFGHRALLNQELFGRPASPAPSVPGTPQSLALPMNPPLHAPSSRRSSFGAGSPGIRRSQSPAPSMPLPAVMPSASPRVGATKMSNIYASEALSSFFRRLTFAPDGSLLFTPAGQFKNVTPSLADPSKNTEEIVNTVYIYSRGGLNKPPIAHLPGHKKPSVAVRCCGTFFTLRPSIPTKDITIDTSATTAEGIEQLPEPVVPCRPSASASMDPPPTNSAPFAAPTTPRAQEGDVEEPPAGPPPAFALPYRIVYAVATQDAVYVYDTQQQTPLCIVSNLHLATFTDLAWSNDGSTLIMCSSDGFCSTLAFAPGELGSVYKGHTRKRSTNIPTNISTSGTTDVTPMQTPTAPAVPSLLKQVSAASMMPSPSPMPSFRPPTPTRTNSNSSVATIASLHPTGVISNPTPVVSNLPSVSVANVISTPHHHSTPLPSILAPTPPMTPQVSGTPSASASAASFPAPVAPPPTKREAEDVDMGVTPELSGQSANKREAEEEADDGTGAKKRRIAPTLVSAPPSTETSEP